MKSTRKKIYEFIKKKKIVSPKDILNQGFVGEQMMYRHLKKLLEDGKIEKIGKSPKTFYRVAQEENIKVTELNKIKIDFLDSNINISNEKILKVIENEFYFVNSAGKELFGFNGFKIWCRKRGFDVQKKAKEFFEIFKKYQKIRRKQKIRDVKSLDFFCI